MAELMRHAPAVGFPSKYARGLGRQKSHKADDHATEVTLRPDTKAPPVSVQPARSSSTVKWMSAAILRSRVGETSRPPRNGTVVDRQTPHRQATCMVLTSTNSASRTGSPSSSSISMTSWRLSCSSARSAPWVCAPGQPGT